MEERWKKPVKSAITSDLEDFEGAQDIDIDGDTDNKYVQVEMSCHSLVKEFFEGRDIEELTQCMFVHIKMQVENSQMSESGFTLDQIMHLCINFHNLALMQDNSYTELAKWIATKKVVINPKN